MHKFVRNLITEWRKLELPVGDATVVVAVSGGADSTSLLAAIRDLTKRKKLALRIIAAHFNHKLRGKESDADEAFVRKLVGEFGFETEVGTGEIPRRGNLEQNARDARYKFLTQVADQNKAAAVLTAHTLNDQAETFLINLIRGSGPDGLAGMNRVRELTATAVLARPLLSWARREDTVEFCRDSDLEFRSDSMNDDPAFTRVRIRKTIIPALAELNPQIVPTLARTAELMRRGDGGERGRGEGETGRWGKGEKGRRGDDETRGRGEGELMRRGDDEDGGELRLSELQALSQTDLYSTLRAWLRQNRGDLRSIEMKHIEAVERLIFSRKSGKTVEIPGRGAVVKQAGRLSFTYIKVEK